jgi:hypothetical protein
MLGVQLYVKGLFAKGMLLYHGGTWLYEGGVQLYDIEAWAYDSYMTDYGW